MMQIRKDLEINDNGNTTCQKLKDAAKTVK
jgi:hypothetical protein